MEAVLCRWEGGEGGITAQKEIIKLRLDLQLVVVVVVYGLWIWMLGRYMCGDVG